MLEYKKIPDNEETINNLLNPVVKKWFFSKFKSYSVPQLFGVTEIYSRNNILISAPTGATKTLTAFLSIINELAGASMANSLKDKVYCIYISPLKALNNDIQKNLKEPLDEIEKIYGKKLGIRVAVRTGDTTTSEKASMLKNPPHILITTPESIALILSSIKFRDLLKDVEWVIIDEIHALAENKRGVHLSLSIERLQRMSRFCRIGLSATVAPLEEVAKFLVGYDNGILRDCKIVDIQFLKDMDLRVLSPVDDLINTTHATMHNSMYNMIDSLIQSHRTTLIFTNTRSATERVVHHLKEKFPKKYAENIGAHHGSLSKRLRFDLEERLRRGELKVVVSSTSLELGIDIGYIDLVILLGSPKSVSRALQRIGRSGHQLHAKTKGRIIVLDRDDLVECAVLLKSAIEKKIDRIHIPKNCLDVLAQQIFGMALEEPMHIHEILKIVKNSYCYQDLKTSEFMEIIDYLAGSFASLESRNIYAKIWYDKETGMVGKRGKLARLIYMTNIGTIPEESHVTVKVGEQVIGTLDEKFLERLKKGDIFVLGGQTYEFLHSRGMVAYVKASVDRPPTVPSWVSEMLPLSFDLAMEIQKFRRLMEEQYKKRASKEQIIEFLHKYLYIDENSANAIYEYFREQYNYLLIPHDKRIVIEHFSDKQRHYSVFHSLFGRRVNDALARAVAYAISRIQHKDVEIGVNDNGFYIASNTKLQSKRALMMLNSNNLRDVLVRAIDNTEVLKRRFRHCATRALMILRNYAGETKNVGKQQVNSTILMAAVKRINEDFSILKEARREILEDLMDIKNAQLILKMIEDNAIKVEEKTSEIPSPFAFNLVLEGYSDILRVEDKIEFLKRMHEAIMGKIEQSRPIEISLSDTRKDIRKSYEERFGKNKIILEQLNDIIKIYMLPRKVVNEIIRVINKEQAPSEELVENIRRHSSEIEKWPYELRSFMKKISEDGFDYDEFWREIEQKEAMRKEAEKEILINQIYKAASKEKLNIDTVHNLFRLVYGEIDNFPKEFIDWLDSILKGPVKKSYPDELVKFLMKARKEIRG